jgi:hypothetical protein
MGAENLTLPVFDLRAVQRIASRYMDYATPAHTSRSLRAECCEGYLIRRIGGPLIRSG